MNDDQEKENIENILRVAVRSETRENEEVLWSAIPDYQALPFQLLKVPLIWLVGLFLYSAGAINRESGAGQDQFLQMMVFVFILIAVIGVVEIIAIPIQSKKTIFVITNLRTLIIKLRAKFGYKGMDDYSLVSKKMIRPEKSTLYFYWSYTLPFQIIFIILFVDVFIRIVEDYNILCLIGFGFLITGWLYQWYQDFRIPLPQFREIPRAFYIFNEWISSIESIELDSKNKIFVHSTRNGPGNIFILSKGKGCMRLKSVPKAKEVTKTLEEAIIIKESQNSESLEEKENHVE